MKGLSCIRAGSLIAARAAGLSRADGLWLEEHVAGCADCAEEAALIAGVRAVAQGFAPELSIEARSRALRVALQSRVSSAPASLPFGRLAFGLAGALATLAVVGTLAWRGQQSAELASATTQPKQPSAAAAQLTARDRIEAQLASGAKTHFAVRTQVALAHATLELAPGSDAQWNAGSHELALLAGEVLAEVDPAAHQAFAIVTRDFRAEVLGTRFEVTQSSVSVLRGRVRIVGSDGEQRAVLGAGESYDHTELLERLADEDEAEPEPEPRAANGRAAREADVPALLTAARDALAAGRFATSRTAIDAALAAKPSRSSRAEALTLRADLLKAEGNRAAAITAYLEVANRFDELAAGEIALYAAASLHTDRAAAKALLQRYLARYPRGRFVVEAKYRLERASK